MGSPEDNRHLLEFGELRGKLHQLMRSEIIKLSSDELDDIKKHAAMATAVNCSWCVYDISRDAAALASIELGRRKKNA